MYEQREIVIIPFPYSDLTGSKYRPTLIISNGIINKTQDRVCCLITSQEPDNGVVITGNSIEKGKLPFKSWVKPYRLFTIHEKIIKKTLCKINGNFHDTIIASINEFVKREP